MKERQRIAIEGKDWNSIVKLPCFDALYRGGGGSFILRVRADYYNGNPIQSCEGFYKFAYVGDTLVEYDNGLWGIIHEWHGNIH